MKKGIVATTILSAMLCASAQASIYKPTDTTVNFFGLFGNSTTLIGLFDDSDLSFSGNYLAVKAGGDQITFTPSGTDYSLTNASGLAPYIFSLSGSDYFTLAAFSPAVVSWLAPDSIFCNAVSGGCTLSWSGLLVGLAVDLKEVSPYPTIPVPSSVILLGSGMFGLVAVARRRVDRNAPKAN